MHKLCTASVGSLTHAIKGQRLLEGMGVTVRVVKPDAAKTKKGCSYGLEFSCAELKRVRAALGASHLPIQGYFEGGGGELI